MGKSSARLFEQWNRIFALSRKKRQVAWSHGRGERRFSFASMRGHIRGISHISVAHSLCFCPVTLHKVEAGYAEMSTEPRLDEKLPTYLQK